MKRILNRFGQRESTVHPNPTIVVTTTELPSNGHDEEEKNKHQWDRPIEFVFSLISNSVGLGNVWRFPYLAAKNGGGAFLIPYFVLYFLIGAPLYFLELALGQFTSRGPGTGFKMARGWQGVGVAMIINSVLGTLYYNVIIAWALFYFILSFRKTLLWTKCGEWWNTNACFEPSSQGNFYRFNGTKWNCTESEFNNFTDYGCTPVNNSGRVTVTEEFYYRLLLKRSDGIDDFGTPGDYMSPLLLVSWALIGVCIIRGVQSSGKVAYFTAIFPYVVLLILIIFSATLKGADEGVKYYITPKWEKLGEFKIWQEAASQVFFSLSLSFGSLIAYSAASKFDNKFFSQMCVVVSCDCLTGLFAGFAVFATMGFLADALGETVDTFAQASGPGLAFITYPEALGQMPVSPLFSIIFFAMLLALGLGSQFASTDVIITVLMELFPAYAGKRYIFVILSCTAFFLCSLPFACPGGIYLFEIFQEYTANTSLVFIGFFEVVVIALIYGFNRFQDDVYMMLKKKPAKYYLFATWCITAPILTATITMANLVTSTELVAPAEAGYPEYEYPKWSTALGWSIFAICILPVPAFFIYTYIKEYQYLSAERKGLITSTDDIYRRDISKLKSIWFTAFRLTNLPHKDWGPRRREDQWGRYAHLAKDSSQLKERQPDVLPTIVQAPTLTTTNFDSEKPTSTEF